MGFFKKDNASEKCIHTVNNNVVPPIETIVNDKKVEKELIKRRNLMLFNVKDIEYIIDNFPSMSLEIKKAVNNLSQTLEKTIDYIEDRSSEIIKTNRDFGLSQAYRDTSIAVYDVVKNLKDYTDWMDDRYDKNILEKDNNTSEIKESNIEEGFIQEIKDEENSEIEIYNDLSLIEPKGFNIKGQAVKVEDWDDLLVKTAEILNKQYKDNKNNSSKLEKFYVIDKKSSQNSFRDTVIEMLNEYKISLSQYKIIY